MAIKNVGPGSVITKDFRRALKDHYPDNVSGLPELIIRTSLDGPAWLTSVALDFDLLLVDAVPIENGIVIFPINTPISAGQTLSWTVFTAIEQPAIAAWLREGHHLKFLARKNDLAAGTTWAGSADI